MPGQLSVAVGNGNVTAIEAAEPFGSVAMTFAIGLITGGVVSFVTVTFSVACANSAPGSVARSVKLAFDAPQAAAMLAFTVPFALTTIFDTVTPLTVALALPFTVTASGSLSMSATAATCETDAPAAC